MLKKLALVCLVLLFLLAGINHFWHPASYFSIIPDYLPWHELINYVSGSVEIILAIGLIFSSTRKMAAYGIIALMIVFVPTHIYMIEKAPFQLGKTIIVTPFIAWIRLVVFQPLLIAWAWWVRK